MCSVVFERVLRLLVNWALIGAPINMIMVHAVNDEGTRTQSNINDVDVS